MPLAFTTGTSSHPKNTLQKRKFEIKVLLLVHVLIPGVMLSSLETINPWLSACDLKQQHPGPADAGSCSATRFPAGTTSPPEVELLCPKECPPNESKTNASCLAYLDDARRSAICNFDLGNGIEWLKSFLGTIRLRHCCEYKIIESLSQSLLERVLRGKGECFRIIDSLVEVDNLAARITCEFSEILTRYDCQQPYSVKFSCHDCLEAYRRWACSTLVPYYNETTRIRPCRSVCQSVEQKCPYFLPENKAPSLPTQYAGEPTFLCMDPNIPETGEQQKRSLYPDENTCCVKICGSLKDGLCVENGSSSSSSYNCKSEDLISYEEALNQMADCGGGSEPYGSRSASLECTASEPYSSPHKLGSGAPRASPGPALLLSAYLNLFFRIGRPAAGGFRCCCSCCCYSIVLVFFLLVFEYYYYYLTAFPSWAKMLTCLPLAAAMTADFPRIGFLSHHGRFLWGFLWEKIIIILFLLIERSKLIFNYFKFNSNKWQYYFILISVNLWIESFFGPFTVPPPPPPSCSSYAREAIGSGRGEKTRHRARNRHRNDNDDDDNDDDDYYYYYHYYHLNYYLNYYYYYYHKHSYVYYYKMLRRIAQISKKIVLDSRKSRDDSERIRNLAIKKKNKDGRRRKRRKSRRVEIYIYVSLISMKNENGSTINRIIIRRGALTTTIIIIIMTMLMMSVVAGDFGGGRIAEASIRNAVAPPLGRMRGKSIAGDGASAIRYQVAMIADENERVPFVFACRKFRFRFRRGSKFLDESGNRKEFRSKRTK